MSSLKPKTRAKHADRKNKPKLQYKVRRKIPAPSLHKPESNGKLNDEQLAMPFVLPKRIEAQPFLKWVGGKAGLLPQLEQYFPNEMDRYFEPFLVSIQKVSETRFISCTANTKILSL